MKTQRYLKWTLLAALIFGVILGTLTPAGATPQFSFGGYRRDISNRGAKAQFPYLNVGVPTGQSLEWVMTGDGTGTKYIQSGWLKRSFDSGPRDFIEYACPTVCQTIYNIIPAGSTRIYSVERTLPPQAPSDRWCALVDGVNKVCIANSLLGLNDAPYAYYTGETSDTDANMGGTPTNHYRLSNVQYKTTSNSWLQVDSAYLIDVTSPGTPYRANKGFTNPSTWVENWTQR
jgi:hypothetical protein